MRKSIILGITGSIAAYKGADIASKLVQSGIDVNVVMTESANRLICPATFEALTRNKVISELFGEYQDSIPHISLAKKADLLLIAPATANIIGKIANGIADDMLSTIAMCMKAKQVIIAPAMNEDMYLNPILQQNIEKLKGIGCEFIEPAEGYLACGMTGKGRLADVDEIVRVIKEKIEK